MRLGAQDLDQAVDIGLRAGGRHLGARLLQQLGQGGVGGFGAGGRNGSEQADDQGNERRRAKQRSCHPERSAALSDAEGRDLSCGFKGPSGFALGMTAIIVPPPRA